MNKTITLTDEQYAALQAGEAITIEPPKPKIVPWEPKGGDWYVRISGCVSAGESAAPGRLFGNEFETKEQAEAEAKAMRARNRLAAYVREFAPDWKADWSNFMQTKYHVSYRYDGEVWVVGGVGYSESKGQVYMPFHVAEELVKKLNSGEVVL